MSDDTFNAPVRRTGYDDESDRLARIRAWLTRYPDATLASGEGGVLLRALERAANDSERLDWLDGDDCTYRQAERIGHAIAEGIGNVRDVIDRERQPAAPEVRP